MTMITHSGQWILLSYFYDRYMFLWFGT